MADDRWSEEVIGACITVHRALGAGFKEKTYANALEIEFDFLQIPYEREAPVDLTYRDRPIGKGKMDFVVDGVLVVELKTVEKLHKAHKDQVVSYLRASGLPLGLLLNFHAERVGDSVRRVIHT